VDTATLKKVLGRLRKDGAHWNDPYIDADAADRRDPFRVLVSCVLSLRTKDAVTAAASERLLSRASAPAALARLDANTIARLIYPVGFYRVKAANLRKACGQLVEDFDGMVPDTIEELLLLPGVGRKTANLVVSVGHDKPAICVDTHVHRIMNRWAYVNTDRPDHTEQELRKKLPLRYWKTLNGLLVKFGQNVCVPVSPWCSRCSIARFCPRRGVERSR